MDFNFKPGKKFFYIVLGSMALVLIALGLLHTQLERILPQKLVEKDLPDFIMIASIAVLLWNRKILGDEKKAAAARKLEEDEAAAAKLAEPAEPEDLAGDESKTDARD
jgi:hypothetical protein